LPASFIEPLAALDEDTRTFLAYWKLRCLGNRKVIRSNILLTHYGTHGKKSIRFDEKKWDILCVRGHSSALRGALRSKIVTGN
jgi:hypothetical protein